MLIVAYDIKSDRVRTKFSKLLKTMGRRIQYSIFELKNSKRHLKNIKTEVESKYKKQFSFVDSVVIFDICEGCQKKTVRYGSSVFEEEELIFFV